VKRASWFAGSRHATITKPPILMQGAFRLTNAFAANNPAGFAEAAAASLDLQADRVADGVVLRRQK